MKATIKLKISQELIDLVKLIATDLSQNIGADQPGFYIQHYLYFQPHLETIFSVGEFFGFKATHRILEIGSGLGIKCLLGKAIWGADFTGLEPCADSFSLLQNAIFEFKKTNPSFSYTLINKPGEDTGLPAESFDFAVSFEVLEHVHDPKSVIHEIHRVLKPGGKFFFSTCNYRSFYEGHYRCPWFPFFNRYLASFWVRSLGYNVKFLDEINFITRSQLLSYLRKCGFKRTLLGFTYPNPGPPKLSVESPNGFDPVQRNTRSFFWGRAIQHPLIQSILRPIGMEYKIWGMVEKPYTS